MKLFIMPNGEITIKGMLLQVAEVETLLHGGSIEFRNPEAKLCSFQISKFLVAFPVNEEFKSSTPTELSIFVRVPDEGAGAEDGDEVSVVITYIWGSDKNGNFFSKEVNISTPVFTFSTGLPKELTVRQNTLPPNDKIMFGKKTPLISRTYTNSADYPVNLSSSSFRDIVPEGETDCGIFCTGI